MLDVTSSHRGLRAAIAAVTLVAVVLVALAHQDHPVTAALLAGVVMALGALSMVDVAEQRLPNRITYPLALATITVVVIAGALQGELLRAGVAIGVGLVFAVALMLLRFGMGDVKLAVSVGTIAGWLGWQALATTMLAMALSGALAAVGLMVIHRRRDVAFSYGPFIAIGSVAGMLAVGG